MTKAQIDKKDIDELIKKFFELFNNKARSTHNWDLIYRICIPETIIVKKSGLEQAVYNLKDFIEPRKSILTDGTLTDFEEFEIEEQTVIANNIAQRQARFQKSGYLKSQYFSEQGTKFFHLVRTAVGWQISAVTWEDDKM